MKRGQTTLEYIFLVGVVAVGIIAVITYVSRGHQGNLRSEADQLSAMQYAPGNTNIDNSQTKGLRSTAFAASQTTVKHGDMNKRNTDLADKLTERSDFLKNTVYKLNQDWENLVDTEALAQAKIYRDGTINWDPDPGPMWQPPTGGLTKIEEDMATADDTLKVLNDAADALDKNFIKPKNQDQTTSGVSSSENGRVTTSTSISETLGDL